MDFCLFVFSFCFGRKRKKRKRFLFISIATIHKFTNYSYILFYLIKNQLDFRFLLKLQKMHLFSTIIPITPLFSLLKYTTAHTTIEGMTCVRIFRRMSCIAISGFFFILCPGFEIRHKSLTHHRYILLLPDS